MATAAVAVTVMGITSSAATPAAASTTPSGTSGFHTFGNEIVDPTGAPFVPSGFVLECLARTDQSCERASGSNPDTDSAKITAAAAYWHANFVRLQVSQEQLFSRAPYNAPYVATLDSEIHLANRLGMAVSVTLQEEDFAGPVMPTATAVRFWGFMARHLANRVGVFFDLYNEPRLAAYQGEDWLWNIWQHGGQADANGVTTTYVGMQTLVDTIRHTGAANMIVAEGNGADHDLSLLTTHLLTGQNIAYGIEPNLRSSRSTPAEWDHLFGRTADQVPLVMDAFQDFPTGHCFPASPTILPQLLAYLQAKHLGLVVWTLAPGNTVVGNDLRHPTSYTGTDTQLCVAHRKNHEASAGVAYDPSTNTNGPGQDILTFFRATSRQLPAADLLGTASATSTSGGSTSAPAAVGSSPRTPWAILAASITALGAVVVVTTWIRRRVRRS